MSDIFPIGGGGSGGNAVQRSEANQPNGYLKLDGDGNLPPVTLKPRAGTAASFAGVIAPAGELVMLTDASSRKIVRGDGTTAIPALPSYGGGNSEWSVQNYDVFDVTQNNNIDVVCQGNTIVYINIGTVNDGFDATFTIQPAPAGTQIIIFANVYLDEGAPGNCFVYVRFLGDVIVKLPTFESPAKAIGVGFQLTDGQAGASSSGMYGSVLTATSINFNPGNTNEAKWIVTGYEGGPALDGSL